MQTFEQLKEVSKCYREHNDCTVKGLAVLFGCTYGVAHRALDKHGRQRRRGAPWVTIDAAVSQLSERFGVTTETHGKPSASVSYARYCGVETMTIKQFIRRHPKGVYLLAMRGHVAALRDGVLYDWTADTAQRRQVTGYIKINGEG